MFSLRSALVAGVVATLSLVLAGTALAAPAVVRDTGSYPFATPAAVNSDCAIRAQLVNDSATGRVYARSYASCNVWKRDITVETQLRRTLSNGTVQTWTSGGVSTPSPTWVYTGSVFNGCDTWRAVVRAWITDDYGRRTYTPCRPPARPSRTTACSDPRVDAAPWLRPGRGVSVRR
jgi:hypothetical protein